MQPQFMAMLCMSKGTCIIHETVFEARNKHIHELRRMGADITHLQNSMTTIVKGVKALAGTIVEARDLRGGAALILAGLAAQGETIVQNSEHVERGYARIEDALSLLGADIKLVR